MHPTSPYGSVVNSRPEPKRPVRIPLFPSQAGIIGLHQPTVSDEMSKVGASTSPDGRRIKAKRVMRQEGNSKASEVNPVCGPDTREPLPGRARQTISAPNPMS